MNVKARTLIAMFGALLYAVVGLRMFQSSLVSTIVLMREASPLPGSGGVGGVSLAIDEVFALYGLLALAAIVANRMLSSWARGSERAVTRLHRAHFIAIVVSFVVMIAAPAAVALGVVRMFSFIAVTGVAWGATFVLTAALLGWYALRSNL